MSGSEKSVDLTPFAGGPVLVRFEYVTDDAVYLDGILVDDLSIPELNLDLSSANDDWHADGFRLTGEPSATALHRAGHPVRLRREPPSLQART